MFYVKKGAWIGVGFAALILSLGGPAPLAGSGGSGRTDGNNGPRVKLPSADAQQVQRLAQEISELRKQARYGDAAERAEEIVRMRRAAGQPADWWERLEAEVLAGHLRKAASLSAEAQKELAEADSMDSTIESLCVSAQYVDAVPLAQRQRGVRERWLSAPDPGLAASLNTVGQLLTALGKNEDAEPLVREGLRMRQELFGSEHPRIAESLNSLGTLLRNLARLAESETCHRQAWSIHEKLELLDPSVIDNLGKWIACVSTRGDAAEAKRICDIASAIIQRVPVDETADNREQVLIGKAEVIVNCAESVQDVKTATAMYLEAQQLLEKATSKPHPGKAMILMSLASFSYWDKDWATAEERYRDAIRMLEGLYPDGHGELAFIWYNLACCLASSGKSDAADAAYTRSAEMYENLGWGNHPALIQVLLNHAKFFHARREFGKAETHLLRALAIAERARPDVAGAERERAQYGYTVQLTWVSMALAHLYVREMNEPAKALDVIERGRSRAALDLLARSGCPTGELAKETAVPSVGRVAEALEAERGARAALTDAEHQLPVVDDETVPMELRHERLTTNRAAVAAARERLAGAIDIVTKELETYLPEARVSSATEIQKSLEPGELMLVFGWMDLHVFVLIVPAAGSGAVEGLSLVYGYEEVKQFNELVGLVRNKLARRSGVATREEIVRMTATLLPDRIRSLLRTSRRIVVVPDGPLRHVPFEVLAYPDEPAGKYAADDVGQIVYADSCSIYVNRKAAARRFPPEAKLAALVLADPVLWREAEEPTYPKTGVLLAEVSKEGKAASAGLRRGDVILSCDGQGVSAAADLEVLAGDQSNRDGEQADRTVALQYWRDGETQSAGVQRGGFGAVLEDRSVWESLLEWRYTTRGGGGDDGAGTAPSSLDRWYSRLSALRGAPFEARAIERTIAKAGGEATVLRRERASLDQLENALAGKRYVHFATHGFAGSRENALDPCVVLAKPNDPSVADAAFLTLDRLIRHWRGKLSGCELVVLSACDTQKGVPVGETIMSLPLGFFQAGVPSVVASLWEVDDEATALLMKRFYENLLGQYEESRSIGRRTYTPSQRMSKADALREAKLWLRTLNPLDVKRLRRDLAPTDDALAQAPKSDESRGARVSAASDEDYSHPYYWAGFVLIGDGGPLD